MALIECADKFAMGELYCVLLYDMIRRRLIDDEMNGDKRGRIQPSDVELVYRVTQDGDPLRTLVAQDVLSYGGPRGQISHLRIIQTEGEGNSRLRIRDTSAVPTECSGEISPILGQDQAQICFLFPLMQHDFVIY
ncbi:uncharacterized protein RAG0_16341 [Rhynchosporium agropyri]|uniref:Uncharacterized protein n=1 Tax=Rhynchosporium agropyri TaxID=914238 RepID=A0A1E1LPY7_9HELO|nr:uncharacterized protein RAG0_16341 [Rhynchosporium agropyri]